MKDRRTTWESYVKSWTVCSADEKRALFETCLSPRCIYTDPLTQVQGWKELLDYMMDFQRQIPGGHFVTERFFAHHGRSVAQWRMCDAEARSIGSGVSYGEYDEDGRLVAMTGFFEAPAGTA